MIRYYSIILCALLSFGFSSCWKDDVEPEIPDGKSFVSGSHVVEFRNYAPLTERPVKIHYNIPADGDMTQMPVLIVVPGIERNAADYLESWKSYSDAQKFMVFALEFPKEYYSTSQYTEGGMFENGVAVAQRDWTFSIIEPIFELIKKDTGSRQSKYDIWGHSGGAQFVHRFVTFMTGAKVNRAVAANAGWYTVPSVNIEYPYGLKSSGFADNTTLQRLFSTELIVQLGTADTSRDGLNTSTGAEAQGQNRYARGNHYFSTSEQIASQGNNSFRWSRIEVKGVAHDQAQMAANAAKLLY